MTAPLTSFASSTRPTRTGVWGDIDEGQASLREGTKAYGEILKPELLQQIGTALGGLNGIGALRSGGSTVALNDIATGYEDRVGAYAAGTAAQGAQIGLDAYDRINAEKLQKQARHASFLKTLGSVLGAGIGFIAGGPKGAAVGSTLAGQFSGAPVDDPNAGYA